MKREILYREIGNIDDDLILAANETYVVKNKMSIFYRAAGIAACFCLICTGILYGIQRDTIYINELPSPAVSKVVVPSDENTTTVPMTYEELLAYYGMERMPDSFGEELTKTPQSFFVLYQDQAGDILYDTNILYYNNIDQSKTVSIVLTKTAKSSKVFPENMKSSEINGISLRLASSSNGSGYTAYWADFQLGDVSVRILSDGLNEDAFIDVVTEFIRIMK